jgi:hypothetical protein
MSCELVKPKRAVRILATRHRECDLKPMIMFMIAISRTGFPQTLRETLNLQSNPLYTQWQFFPLLLVGHNLGRGESYPVSLSPSSSALWVKG